MVLCLNYSSLTTDMTIGMPHGQCYLWNPSLTTLHVVSDGVIALAYFIIPVLMFTLFRRQIKTPFDQDLQTLVLSFVAFILCCGVSHLLEIVTVWYPLYWLSGVEKLLTAIVSVGAVACIVLLSPKIRHFINEREQALERLNEKVADLAESEERFRLFQDNSPAIAFMKEEGVIIYANRRLLDAFGAELIGSRDIDLFPPEVANVIVAHDNQVLHTGEPLTMLEIAPDMYGYPRQWLVMKFRIMLRSGVYLGGVGIDVTERELLRWQFQRLNEQLELRSEELIEKNQRLQELDRIKDEFINTVSHEMRTPVTNIKMAIQMLRSVADPKRQQTYMGILEKECEREINLINDLLDLQRVDADREVVSLTPVDLHDWLPQIASSYATRAESLGQVFAIAMSDDLPVIQTDAAKLERILSELLNNACKYTPTGGRIELSVTLLESKQLLFVVRNSVQIPEEALERLFDKFYRLPRLDVHRQGGTGLGLTLIAKLATLLKSYLTVESANDWTVFSFILSVD